LGGVVAGRISLPSAAADGFSATGGSAEEEKKQGKSGSDVPAPREAPYLRMREHGNGTDEPESPPSFSNGIRPAINNDRR